MYWRIIINIFYGYTSILHARSHAGIWILIDPSTHPLSPTLDPQMNAANKVFGSLLAGNHRILLKWLSFDRLRTAREFNAGKNNSQLPALRDSNRTCIHLRKWILREVFGLLTGNTDDFSGCVGTFI